MSVDFFCLSMVVAMHMDNLVEAVDLLTALAKENNQ